VIRPTPRPAPGPLVVNTVIGTTKNCAAGFTTVGIIALAAIVLTFTTLCRRTTTRANTDPD
jgi:hypothetical protein